MSSATYRALLRTPGAAAFFLAAAAGRVGIAMTSLGIVWLVHARTGAYVTAGLVTGGFAVADAVAGPQLARLADRFGQARVLTAVLLAHAGAVATLLALVAAGVPDWLMTAGGVLVGATIPQLGALSGARWVALLPGERACALPTAFALESLANELAYLAGPALVSILGASGYPAAGTVLAGVLVVAGGLCFAAQRRTAPPTAGAPESPTAEGHRSGRSLLRPGFAVLAGVNLSIGAFFGAMQISVTAFAVEHGAPGTAAALFTVSSCASLLAGWLYGRRPWRLAPQVQLAAVAAGLAIACLPLLVAGSPLELGLCVALTGLAVPLNLVLCSVLAEATVHRAVLTQAFAWLGSASAAGSAAAAAVAGWAVGAFGAHGGFTVAAVATGVMAVLATAGLRVPLNGAVSKARSDLSRVCFRTPSRQAEESAMPVRFQIVIDCQDPELLARFWAAALGYVLESPPEGFATWDDWRRDIGFPDSELGLGADSIVDPDGAGPRIWFHALPDAKVVKNRLHFDIHVSGGRTVVEGRSVPLATRIERVDAEARRLADLGATLTGRLGDDDGLDHYAVGMRDPEGNEFDIN